MLPSPALASCVRAYVIRSTVGCAMAPHHLYNHFPASPACAITWFLQGESIRLPGGEGLPARVVLRGPQTRPVLTYNPGPVRMFIALVTPDALRSMAGIDPGQLVDRLAPAADVLGADWLPLLDAVAHAPDDDARVQRLEAFLEPRWTAARAGSWTPALKLMDWSRSLARRAETSGVGRSTRQVARRIREHAGLPLRSLLGLSRAERALRATASAASTGAVDWPQVAAEAAFADQAHLCRETMRFSGVSPAELARRMQHEEAFWVYRLWGAS